jgi:hypothetical protein
MQECSTEKCKTHAVRMMGTREYARVPNNYLDTIQDLIFETHPESLVAGESVSAETKKMSLPGSLMCQ